MFSGAYSQRFQGLETEQIERLKETSTANRGDVLAKSKLLSHETNRRRRALAIKRRVDAQREEKRRQEILNKRRQRQKEATEKFQRQYLRRTGKDGQVTPQSPHSQRESPQRGVTSALIPGLEEALRAVRGSPTHRHNAGGYITRHGTDDSLRAHTEALSDGKQKAFYSKYGSKPPAPAPPTKDKVQEQAARDDLHSRSLRNLTNSRSLFEQQLEQHQQTLLEQQQLSLREFNNAVQREVAEQGRTQLTTGQEVVVSEPAGELTRSESLSSLDSLEAHCSPEKENSFIDTGPVNGEPLSLAVDSVSASRRPTTFTDSPSERLKAAVPVQCSVGVQGKPTSNKPNTNTLGVPFVDSSRSDITADTVSTIDIREGGSQRHVTVPPKQFFMPRYDTFTEHFSTANTDKGLVNEWVSQQNDLLTNSAHLMPFNGNNLQHASGQNDNSRKDEGTFYVKAWAPTNANTAAVATRVPTNKPASSHPTTAPPGGQPTVPHQAVSHVVRPMTRGDQSDSKPAHNVHPPQTVPTPSAKHSPHRKTGVATPTSNNRKPVSNQGEAKSLSNGAVPDKRPEPTSRIPVQNRYIAGSHAPPAYAATETTPDYNKVSVGITVNNGPVIRSEPPGIFNGGLGFSNGCLTVNGEVSDCDEASDSGSANRDDQSESSQGSRQLPNQPKTTDMTEVKSILKKNEANKHHSLHKRSNSFGGKPSSPTGVRDSLEVIRLHKTDNKAKPHRKKSVRFADMTDEQTDRNDEEKEKITPVKKVEAHKATVVSHKPPRPASARITSSSPKDSPSPARRVVSAGPMRPMPQAKAKPVVRPQAAAHIITHRSSFTSPTSPISTANGYHSSFTTPINTNSHPSSFHGPVTTANGHQISLVSSNSRPTQQSVRAQTSPTKTTVSPPGKYPPPVYDDSGLRLDRTPTDDEINWLWDKVRTCLHRESQTSSRVSETTDNSARHPVSISSKVIDGTMLGQHASVSRVAASSLRRYNSAESVNTYSKRNALLQQRQQQPSHSLTPHRTGAHGPPQAPKLSLHDPQVTTLNTNQNHEVSESMAGFLAAEALAEQSVSESVLRHAVERAQQQQQAINASRPANKVPTALSVEEQRLMESIDKLNEKLKITENKVLSVGTGLQQSQYVHRPSLVNEEYRWRCQDDAPGFRGHQPLVGAHRRGVDATAGRSLYRTGSGTVTQAKTQYRYY